ncbi:MAG: class I SAM-dependent methyltransferase [Rhodospirillaceae bacterium]
MAAYNYLMPDALHDYLVATSVDEPAVLRELREATDARPDGVMSSPPELGQFLALTIELTGAKTVLELGTFTGYGALWMALALPPDGRLIAIDVNEDAHGLARKFWAKAGVADRIDLRVGEVRDHLPAVADEIRGRLDFAFVDADKPGYGDYYDVCIDLLRRGGVIAFDNVFQGGAVADPESPPRRKHAATMRAFNDRICRDERVTTAMLPIGDGVLIARKR